jgi:HTH-type transcriptional regulator, sugar sensing transcriptional regulator
MRQEYKKQIQRFLELGLTERETKVYITLLSKKSFTSSELQKSANIPRTKIYEVLLKMVERGICLERRIGKIKYYEAVEPKKALHKVLEDYKNNFQYELDKKKEITESLAGIFNPIYQQNKNFISPLEFVEVIKDKEQAQKRILDAFKEAKSETVFLIKGPYVCDTNTRVNQQIKEEKNMLKRGVKCKKIYESGELLQHTALIEQFKPLAKLGSQLRMIEQIPIKMVVFDERKVIFPLQDIIKNPDELTIILIEHKEMVSACRILFNFLWSNSKPLLN